MPKEDTQFNSITASEAGKKSKRGVSIKTHLQKMLDSGEVDVKDLVISMFENSKKGNGQILKIIMEYLEGKPTDTIKLEGSVKEDVNINFVD